MLERVWRKGNALALLAGMQTSTATMENCGERAPPVAKVMRKEAWHTQRRDQASGVSLEILEHLPPNQSLPTFCFVLSPTPLTLQGGCPPLPLSEKRATVFQPTNSFGSPLACVNRFFRPHVIVQSLPTVRGRRCSKLSKHRFFWVVKRLIRNCIGEGFFTYWANVYC